MFNRTSIDDIVGLFLGKIDDIELATEYTNEEIIQYVKLKMRSALAKFVTAEDITFDGEIMDLFNRKLEPLEQEIIVSLLVVEWLTPQINSLSIIRQNLNNKEFKKTSQANQLEKLMILKDKSMNEAHYWMNRYPFLKLSKSMRKGR